MGSCIKGLYTFNKNSSGTNSLGGAVKGTIMLNQEPAIELHTPVVIKFERRKAHSRFIDNIWRAGLAFFNVFLTKIYYVNKNL